MSIKESDVLVAIVASVENVTGKSAASVTPDTSLIGDLHMESIDIVDLLYEIEKKLGVSINLADVFQNRREARGQRDQFDLKISEIVAYVVALVSS